MMDSFFRYLIPEVLRKFNQLGISGAIIADTIMNYNSTPGSQEVFTSKHFPFL